MTYLFLIFLNMKCNVMVWYTTRWERIIDVDDLVMMEYCSYTYDISILWIFPYNMLWLDFSPLSCCCVYGVCTGGVQILGTRRSSCGTLRRLRRDLSSVNFILVMIRHVVKYELWYVTLGLGLTMNLFIFEFKSLEL